MTSSFHAFSTVHPLNNNKKTRSVSSIRRFFTDLLQQQHSTSPLDNCPRHRTSKAVVENVGKSSGVLFVARCDAYHIRNGETVAAVGLSVHVINVPCSAENALTRAHTQTHTSCDGSRLRSSCPAHKRMRRARARSFVASSVEGRAKPSMSTEEFSSGKRSNAAQEAVRKEFC